MVLFNIKMTAAVPTRRKGGKGKAPALAKAAVDKKPSTSRWSAIASALPRTIRSRLIARSSRPEPRQAAASGWALGPWLGSVAATASAALASVQGGAAARAAAPAGGEALYIDRDGNAHLGVNAGDDKAIFHAMRQMQAEEQSVQARSVERRRPEMAANRRAAAAAAKRSPRLTKRAAATGRSAKRKADHQTFQPRKQN